MRAALLILGMCGWLLHADDVTKDKLVVKEIDIKGVKLEPMNGRFMKPIELTSAEDLAKIIADKEVQEGIKKEVNFDRHKLLYFAWSGSGQDRVTANIVEEDGKKAVVFGFTPGRTKDLRRHFRLFAIDKVVPYKLGR